MILVSVCLSSDALSQHLSSYLGFSYLGCGVSLPSCFSKVQPLLLTLDKGYFLTATPPDLERGVAPFCHPVPTQHHSLDVGFQRIVRRDKKAFLSDQCKEIEENNRMGKTRDLFKEIRDTKGTFHAKVATIKDRKGKQLTETEEIKKNTQKNYTKKIFMAQIITMV